MDELEAIKKRHAVDSVELSNLYEVDVLNEIHADRGYLLGQLETAQAELKKYQVREKETLTWLEKYGCNVADGLEIAIGRLIGRADALKDDLDNKRQHVQGLEEKKEKLKADKAHLFEYIRLWLRWQFDDGNDVKMIEWLTAHPELVSQAKELGIRL